MSRYILTSALISALLAPHGPLVFVRASAAATNNAIAGVASATITGAVRAGQPERQDWEVVDELLVTCLFVQRGGTTICLLSYDLCEITRGEVQQLRAAVTSEIATDQENVHIYCTHNHSSSDTGRHDLQFLMGQTRAAARQARKAAISMANVGFLRVDTGKEFTINRRSRGGKLGTWCLMQSRGCVDDGQLVDGTEWVRQRIRGYGATQQEAAEIEGPYLADRDNDPYLGLVLFFDADGSAVAGLVRFTAHPVICSAGYWRPNLGRDFPGVLCNRLREELGCPLLFLQGTCGDHRPRHRDVGIDERNRIGGGLAQRLMESMERLEQFPLDEFGSATRLVNCPMRAGFPTTAKQASDRIAVLSKEAASLPRGLATLGRRKQLHEQMRFLSNVGLVFGGFGYLLPGEIQSRSAMLEISHVWFGPVHLLNFPGELFSTVTAGLEREQDGRTVVTSYANGVSGYLLPRADFQEGGYEWTWALFDPEGIENLRAQALDLLN